MGYDIMAIKMMWYLPGNINREEPVTTPKCNTMTFFPWIQKSSLNFFQNSSTPKVTS